MSGEKSPGERKKGKNDKIVVEKAEAEDLPPGWTKEVRIRKKGSKIRKDPYYKDPVTGYTFRSLRDVQRYLKTGKLGRLAIKPKDSSCADMDSEDGKSPMQSEADEEKLSYGTMDDEMAGQQSLKVVEMKNVEKVVESTSTEECPCISDHASLPCVEKSSAGNINRPEANGLEEREGKENDDVSDVNLSQANCLEEREGKENAVESNVNLPEGNGSEELEGKENTAVTSFMLVETNGVEQREEKSESKEQITTATPSSETPLHKRPLENGSEGHRKRTKSSEKSKLGLPRRASKRLAGIEVDITPLEAETKSRRQAMARRARVAESGTTTTTNLPTNKHGEKAEMGMTTTCRKQVDPICMSEVSASTPGEHVVKGEIDTNLRNDQGRTSPPASDLGTNADINNKVNLKQEILIPLPPESFLTVEESCEKVKQEVVNANEKRELHIVLPPVISSSAKEHDGEIQMHNVPQEKQALPTTLPPMIHTTAKEYTSSVEMGSDNPNEKQVPSTFVPPVSLEVRKDKKPHEKQELPVVAPPVALPIPEDSHGGVKSDAKAHVKSESPVNFSLNDFWTDPCIEFAVKTLTGDIPIVEEHKAEKFPTSEPELPLEELWTDPCIEFAVKTLTGAIPIAEDLCVQDYLQHQPTSSSDTRGDNSFSLPDGGTNFFCQTEVLSKHFEMAENSHHIKQQELGLPAILPNHHVNGSLQNSGNSALHHQVKGSSSGECSRPRFFY